MASTLSSGTVDIIRRQAGELKTQLGLILNNLDGFPSYVIANLYEGLHKEELETHNMGIRYQQQSVARYINRLQDAANNLKYLKFDGRGQETREQRSEWGRNVNNTIQSNTVNVFGNIKDEVLKNDLQLTAETIQLSCRMIKQTLDNMYQQTTHFQENSYQRQNQLKYLKEYIPQGLSVSQLIGPSGSSAYFSGPGLLGQGSFNPTDGMLNNQMQKMRRDLQNQYTAGLLDSASKFVSDVHQVSMNHGSNYGRPYRFYY